MAPRWKHLRRQHGITGGTLARILARIRFADLLADGEPSTGWAGSVTRVQTLGHLPTHPWSRLIKFRWPTCHIYTATSRRCFSRVQASSGHLSGLAGSSSTTSGGTTGCTWPWCNGFATCSQPTPAFGPCCRGHPELAACLRACPRSAGSTRPCGPSLTLGFRFLERMYWSCVVRGIHYEPLADDLLRHS